MLENFINCKGCFQTQIFEMYLLKSARNTFYKLTGPLSSTHQFHIKGALLFSPKNHSVPHYNPLGSTPQFHTLLSPTPKTPQFHTLLSSTPKISHFNTLLSSTPKGVWNWGAFRVELRDFGYELRGFWCWKGVFLVRNRCVELRGSVWNWGVPQIYKEYRRIIEWNIIVFNFRVIFH